MNVKKTKANGISFVIPVYNQKQLPLKAINSIILQDVENIEIVIVEDGSSYLQKQLAEFFACYDNVQCKYISLKENKGTFLARIEGVKNTSFDHVCFLDSDDYYSNEDTALLNNLYTKALKEDLDIIQFGFVKEYNGFFRKKVSSKNKLIDNKKTMLDSLLYKKRGYNLTFMWNKIYKKSLLIKVIELHKLSDIKQRLTFAEDYYMQYCIFTLAKSITLTDKEIYVYTKVKKFFFFKKSQSYYLKALQDVENILTLIKQSQSILDKQGVLYKIERDINKSFVSYFKRVLRRKRFSDFKTLKNEFKAFLKRQS